MQEAIHPDTVGNLATVLDTLIKEGSDDAIVIDISTGKVITEDFETMMARGRIHNCFCDLICCECKEALKHMPECYYRGILIGPIEIECEHGLGTCLQCDQCTCGLDTWGFDFLLEVFARIVKLNFLLGALGLARLLF